MKKIFIVILICFMSFITYKENKVNALVLNYFKDYYKNEMVEDGIYKLDNEGTVIINSTINLVTITNVTSNVTYKIDSSLINYNITFSFDSTFDVYSYPNGNYIKIRSGKQYSIFSAYDTYNMKIPDGIYIYQYNKLTNTETLKDYEIDLNNTLKFWNQFNGNAYLMVVDSSMFKPTILYPYIETDKGDFEFYIIPSGLYEVKFSNYETDYMTFKNVTTLEEFKFAEDMYTRTSDLEFKITIDPLSSYVTLVENISYIYLDSLIPIKKSVDEVVTILTNNGYDPNLEDNRIKDIAGNVIPDGIYSLDTTYNLFRLWNLNDSIKYDVYPEMMNLQFVYTDYAGKYFNTYPNEKYVRIENSLLIDFSNFTFNKDSFIKIDSYNQIPIKENIRSVKIELNAQSRYDLYFIDDNLKIENILLPSIINNYASYDTVYFTEYSESLTQMSVFLRFYKGQEDIIWRLSDGEWLAKNRIEIKSDKITWIKPSRTYFKDFYYHFNTNVVIDKIVNMTISYDMYRRNIWGTKTDEEHREYTVYANEVSKDMQHLNWLERNIYLSKNKSVIFEGENFGASTVEGYTWQMRFLRFGIFDDAIQIMWDVIFDTNWSDNIFFQDYTVLKIDYITDGVYYSEIPIDPPLTTPDDTKSSLSFDFWGFIKFGGVDSILSFLVHLFKYWKETIIFGSSIFLSFHLLKFVIIIKSRRQLYLR